MKPIVAPAPTKKDIVAAFNEKYKPATKINCQHCMDTGIVLGFPHDGHCTCEIGSKLHREAVEGVKKD
jgi:tartrate dehydratase alpha subunit/fumarate hydratase class I-like protein